MVIVLLKREREREREDTGSGPIAWLASSVRAEPNGLWD